jgi:hypothetical protein
LAGAAAFSATASCACTSVAKESNSTDVEAIPIRVMIPESFSIGYLND